MWSVAGTAVDPERFGPLRPVKVLYEFDGPRTFTFRDRDGELCLAHWCDESEQTTRYIVVAFSNRLLAKLEQGIIPMRDALEQPRAWILDESPEGNVRSAWRVEISDLPEEVLPRPGALLTPMLERARNAVATPKSA